MNRVRISDEIMIRQGEALGLEIFIVQEVGMYSEDVIKEIVMSRDVAVRMAKDILKDVI